LGDGSPPPIVPQTAQQVPSKGKKGNLTPSDAEDSVSNAPNKGAKKEFAPEARSNVKSSPEYVALQGYSEELKKRLEASENENRQLRDQLSEYRRICNKQQETIEKASKGAVARIQEKSLNTQVFLIT